MVPALELTGLTKTYGKSRGVEDISVKVNKGSTVGFLGPNGSGKSTTMNMLIGYSKPTAGHATIFGKDIVRDSVQIRRDVGFLASDMALDSNLTGKQQLEYFGHLRGNYEKKYVTELAERLSCDLSRKTKTLSRGNKQKVALIAALMHRPKLLLLDEPTSGLDPLIQAEFNKIILEHKAAGHTAFISSHVLSEVQELCDNMVFIREGRVIANKTLSELTAAAPKQIKITSGDSRLVSKLKSLKGTTALTQNGRVITFGYTDTAKSLISTLQGHEIDDITIENADLENLFMDYYGTGAKDA